MSTVVTLRKNLNSVVVRILPLALAILIVAYASPIRAQCYSNVHVTSFSGCGEYLTGTDSCESHCSDSCWLVTFDINVGTSVTIDSLVFTGDGFCFEVCAGDQGMGTISIRGEDNDVGCSPQYKLIYPNAGFPWVSPMTFSYTICGYGGRSLNVDVYHGSGKCSFSIMTQHTP